MNLGQLTIWCAFFSALGAAYSYYHKAKSQSRSPKSDQKNGIAQNLPTYSYQLTIFASLTASVFLFYLLLNHQFQYSYVAKNSSHAQPLLYLISAFWAGQEGTFLLWATLTTVMGWIFLKTSRREDEYAMSVVSAYVAFLYLLMIVKSPFEMTSTTPVDGSGMNPLLQDPWMAVHPPILFIGYAATIFPFAMVVSGLLRRNYDNWFRSGFSWTLFAAMTLGAGIIIGGFWAYEVLGWGGYWGWDPVENSSLVPWLTLLALIHGLLVQKSKGSLVRTNLFLGITSFLLVLYATFLTRSGVLTDFSVHSFTDLGISNYLIAVMVVSAVVGLGLFAARFRGITSPKIDISHVNREVMLILSLFVLCAGALFTFVGMSSPILTGLVGKASQVDTSFYNKVNMPVAIAMALLLGMTPFLGWVEENFFAFMKRLSMPLALTALACIIAYVAGITSLMLMIFVGSASFGLISNAIIVFRQYKSGWMSLGGPAAHIGVALLLIGIVGSGKFDRTSRIVLKSNESQQLYGYEFTFRGVDETGIDKPRVKIEVSDGKNIYLATPKLYFSQYNQAMMREPDIKVFPLNDLYISPLEFKGSSTEQAHNPLYELTKGETKEIAGYKVTFAKFEMGQHGQPGGMAVGAVLHVSVDGQTHEIIPQLMFDERGGRSTIPSDLPSRGGSTNGTLKTQVALNAISVEEKKVLLELVGGEQLVPQQSIPQLIVEISTKPLMMVVWTGVVFMILGTAIAFKHRLGISEQS